MYMSRFLTHHDTPSIFNFNGLYSVGSSALGELGPSVGELMVIHSLSIRISDTGTNGFGANDYGNITDGLINGIDFRMNHEGIYHNLNPLASVKTNSQYALFADKVETVQWGSGDDHLSVYNNFGINGQPIILKEGEFFECLFKDDFSLLSEHMFFLQGEIGVDCHQNRQMLDNKYIIDWDTLIT